MLLVSEKRNYDCGTGVRRGLILTALVLVLIAPGAALAATKAQRTFSSAEEAVKILVETLRAEDTTALKEIFGPESEELIDSGDPVEDKERRTNFVAMYDEKSSLAQVAEGMELSIGNAEWPFPIPLVQEEGKWRFDTEAGRDEILARRIGKNEWAAVQFCLAYVDAQREYAQKDRDGDGLLAYARAFRSEPGQQNGLYWETREGEEQSPLGALAAVAEKHGYRKETGDAPAPFLGYYFRILTGQGANAPGGAYDYLVRDKLLGGFAMVAYPANYQSTGIMTFLVNHEGQVYQKDLGEKTETAAETLTLYDPDNSWQKVEEQITRKEEAGAGTRH